MASQSTHDMQEDPSDDGQPPIMIQHDTFPDPHVGPMEALERHGDQAGNQDPRPQDNPNQSAANVEGNNTFLGLSFPIKLWRIVEDDVFTSVHWNEAGDTIIIEVDLFQREILCRRGEEQIFESESLKTFIRLLNLHGFHKIRPGDSSVCSPRNKIMIYQNSDFQRGKPWLLENIKTKGTRITSTSPGSRATPPKRKKKMVPTRHSPRIHHKECDKKAEQKAQRNTKNARGSSATRPFKFSVLRPRSSAMEAQGPSEADGPNGEGMPENVTFVPTAAAGADGTGDLPTSFPNDPLQGSVISLFNICYSILIAGLSVMAPPEDPDEEEEEEAEEEEEEGSSDTKCSLCEQFKDYAGP